MKARGKQDQAGGKPTWAAAPAKSQPTELFSLGQEGARREGWAFTPLPGADPGTPRTLVRQVSEAEAVPTGTAGPSLRGSEVMESGRYTWGGLATLYFRLLPDLSLEERQ